MKCDRPQEEDFDISGADGDGKTSLIWAATNGHLEVVRLLVDTNADLNAKTHWGYAALACAAWYGHFEVVAFLAQREVNFKDLGAAFVCAYGSARKGTQKVVEFLLEAGADVDAKEVTGNYQGWTALMIASYRGELEKVKWLLEAQAAVNLQNFDGVTPLGFAASKGHLEVVNLLLSAGADVDSQSNNGETALTFAAKLGDCEMIRTLLEAKASLELRTIDGRTALSLAAEKGYSKVVKLLLEAMAELETKDEFGECRPLDWAVWNGHREVVDLLLEFGAEIEPESKSRERVLRSACQRGDPGLVQRLLDAGVMVDSKNALGRTALSIAVQWGHAMVVRDVDLFFGYASMSFLWGGDRLDVAKLLLEAGASIEEKDIIGRTALNFAAQGGNVKMVKLLLDAKADPNSTGDDGITPLARATRFGQLEVAKLLLEACAKMELQSDIERI